ncbi:hypothetical protein [Paenibacillus sp. PK3_47]|uniref:phospholipase D-like domain-containing protein n=1 Tax=Paenibacillus sp. PK3_47 TaxID=2072642 RepID=UPI00201E5933|nr:hypothetical protein [Paenibacillus sp. PK3_47]
MNKTLPRSEWDGRLQQNILDFVNYTLSGGSLHKVIEGAEEAEVYLKDVLEGDTGRAYRQSLGGVLTEAEQLAGIPGLRAGQLEQLAFAVNAMDSSKLRALAPQTTRHNRVDPYVNGPQCLEMILGEIRQAERYIHLSVMLFFNDKSGNMIADELLHALERGVEVRMMVDKVTTAVGYGLNLEVGNFSKIAERLEQAGAKVLNTFNSCCPPGEWGQGVRS